MSLTTDKFRTYLYSYGQKVGLTAEIDTQFSHDTSVTTFGELISEATKGNEKIMKSIQ